MDEQEKTEEVLSEVTEGAPAVEESSVEKTEETVTAEQETERERNLKAENRRKQEEVIKLREELERARETRQEPESEVENIKKQLLRMNDNELRSYLNNQQYSNLHFTISEILDERKFERFQSKQEEKRLRLDAEIELEQNFPEVLNPSSPMALRTKELIRQKRLENHPQGRLIAAQLAASELGKKKVLEAGRKAEVHRQADVKANFQGDAGRPAPVKSGSVKLDELKKRAMAGDEAARKLWFKHKGLI